MASIHRLSEILHDVLLHHLSMPLGGTQVPLGWQEVFTLQCWTAYHFDAPYVQMNWCSLI